MSTQRSISTAQVCSINTLGMVLARRLAVCHIMYGGSLLALALQACPGLLLSLLAGPARWGAKVIQLGLSTNCTPS